MAGSDRILDTPLVPFMELVPLQFFLFRNETLPIVTSMRRKEHSTRRKGGKGPSVTPFG